MSGGVPGYFMVVRVWCVVTVLAGCSICPAPSSTPAPPPWLAGMRWCSCAGGELMRWLRSRSASMSGSCICVADICSGSRSNSPM